MKKTCIALALAAAPFCSMASEANGIGYDYVQLDGLYEDADGYARFLYDEHDFSGKGARLSGSYAFTDHLFVTASAGRTKGSNDTFYAWYNYSNADETREGWSLGLGYNQSIGTKADWVSHVAYVNSTVEYDEVHCASTRSIGHINEGPFIIECNAFNDEVKLDGFNLSTGVRTRMSGKLTGDAYLGYEDYDKDHEGDFYAALGVGFEFNPTWSLQSGVRLNGDAQIWNLGVRASF
ncbi:hypothetical protein [Lysobacter panacisoli]|uniref:Uncharacterized protein n=1 Tax=Lysobacter panacisoli TaxID=1255263 RepID=A0ABP9L9J2_9GAMM|nr:hypothetical protein [Lysobacter panacisoli]